MPTAPQVPTRCMAALFDFLAGALFGMLVLATLSAFGWVMDVASAGIVCLLIAYAVLNYHPYSFKFRIRTFGERVMGVRLGPDGKKIAFSPFLVSRIPALALSALTLASGFFIFIGLTSGVMFSLGGAGLAWLAATLLAGGVVGFFSTRPEWSLAAPVGLLLVMQYIPKSRAPASWGAILLLFLLMLGWVVAHFYYTRRRTPRQYFPFPEGKAKENDGPSPDTSEPHPPGGFRE